MHRWLSIWSQNNLSSQDLKRYTPIVARDEPDGWLLEVSGSAHLFGGEHALMQHIQSNLSDAQIAIAPTPGSAWALSHFKPNMSVDHHNLKQVLSPLPIACLRLPNDISQTLSELAITSVHELLRLPRASLFKRFGKALIDRLDQVFGDQVELVQSIPEQIDRQIRVDFMDTIRDAATLDEAIFQTLAPFCRDIRDQFEELSGLGLTLIHIDRSQTQFDVRVSHPTHHAKEWMTLLKLKLDRLDLGFGIDAVELKAIDTRRIQSNTRRSEWSSFIDLVSNRIGEANVFHLMPHESHIPEKAVVRQFPSQLKSRKRMTHNARPVRLIHPPQSIRITPHMLHNAHGPERITPEWWSLNTNSQTRDYYRITTAQSRCLWVFQDGESQKWYLQGYFA